MTACFGSCLGHALSLLAVSLSTPALSRQVTNPYRTILKPAYRPQLYVACTATLFQQLTGINSICFFAPQLFMSLGLDQNSALMANVVIGTVGQCAGLVSLWAADVYGRRPLFLQAGVQVCVSVHVRACICDCMCLMACV